MTLPPSPGACVCFASDAAVQSHLVRSDVIVAGSLPMFVNADVAIRGHPRSLKKCGRPLILPGIPESLRKVLERMERIPISQRAELVPGKQPE